jgi:hypothetical protein
LIPALTPPENLRGGFGASPKGRNTKGSNNNSSSNRRYDNFAVRSGQGFGLRIANSIKIDVGVGREGIQRVHIGVVDPFF